MRQKTAKWALIMGGSSGLGLATTKKLIKSGFNVIVLHRSKRSDNQCLEEILRTNSLGKMKFLNFNVDALNIDKRMAVIEELKVRLSSAEKIGVLVHSIAKGNLRPMYAKNYKELTHQDFQLTINAMALSLYDWTKALFKAKLFSEDTRIISYTSEGNVRAWQNYAAVSTAKVALEAITRNIALEFASVGIKANCIQAGMTDTNSFRMIPGSEELKKNAIERNPNNRLTTPEDVANAAYLLCLEEAKWITGTVIKVDGGESLQ